MCLFLNLVLPSFFNLIFYFDYKNEKYISTIILYLSTIIFAFFYVSITNLSIFF